jgi:hypothetical protein
LLVVACTPALGKIISSRQCLGPAASRLHRT